MQGLQPPQVPHVPHGEAAQLGSAQQAAEGQQLTGGAQAWACGQQPVAGAP